MARCEEGLLQVDTPLGFRRRRIRDFRDGDTEFGWKAFGGSRGQDDAAYQSGRSTAVMRATQFP